MSEPPAAPRQASLRRLREFEVRPNRELGQNFLIDDNILRVIGDAAELTRSDVVLEVGGGLGVLSEYLAPRVAHLHVVEVDRRLEPPLRDALDPFANADLHLADALELDFGALDPLPDKVVANLPYGVAATVLLKSIAELPAASLWVAMVQREVADRFAAPPGNRSYGATSVLAQLSADVRVAAQGAAHGLPPGSERRFRAGRAAPHRAGAAGRPGGADSCRLRPPPQGAGRLAGAGARRAWRHPRRDARRARAHRPTR